MPPMPGSVDRKPSDAGGLIGRGVGTPPYGPGRKRVIEAAISARAGRRHIRRLSDIDCREGSGPMEHLCRDSGDLDDWIFDGEDYSVSQR